jgi:hypothetical protein
MGKQLSGRIKRTLVILLLVFFIAYLTTASNRNFFGKNVKGNYKGNYDAYAHEYNGEKNTHNTGAMFFL